MGRSKASQQKVKADELRLRCLELRKRGLTYRGIASKAGCSVRTAHKHVMNGLQELQDSCHEKAEQLRTIEHQRLEGLYVIAIGRTQHPDPDVAGRFIGRCIDISRRISKLWGLDAPELLGEDPDNRFGDMDAAAERAIAKLRRVGQEAEADEPSS